MKHSLHRRILAACLLGGGTVWVLPTALLAQTLDNLPPVAPLTEDASALPAPVTPPLPQASALPDVQVPTVPTVVPADQTMLPIVPSQPAETSFAEVADAPSLTPTIPLDAPFSYGAFSSTLMFAPSRIEAMKRVLNDYEMKRRMGTAGDIEVVEEQAPPPVIVPEPDAYPVFTLGSIAYRARNDWTVWISGLRITPKTNDQEIRVVAVGPDRARFMWKPNYIDSLKRRVAENKIVNTDAVKHKATRPNTALLDAQTGQVYFSLKPNQSFAPGYMATFEGKIAAPTLEKLEPLTLQADGDLSKVLGEAGAMNGTASPQGETRDVLPPSATTGLAGDSIRRMYQKAGGSSVANPQDTLDTLLKNNESVKSIAPPRGARNAPAQP